MSRKQTASLPPPFLKRFEVLYDRIINSAQYPFSIPAIKNGDFSIDFDRKVTIIVGDNGVGKSTILEAIAANCGFSLTGGTQNHSHFSTEKEFLSDATRLSWLPKVSKGFFLRAETFFSFINTIDDIATESGDDIYDAYGGRSLRERSHGESFLALFENRFGSQGMYILDEPEVALSPQRQIDFLRLIKKMDDSNKCQIIMATHSVMLMAYPGAQLLRITDDGVRKVEFHETPHFKILHEFFRYPDAFMESILSGDPWE